MAGDTLKKFEQKKKNWITPKHALYFEDESVKYTYCAAVLIQASLCKSINVLNNYELIRLLKRGLEFDSRQMTKVVQYSKNAEQILDEVLLLQEKPLLKYLFILDLATVSFRQDGYTEQEKESINGFCDLLQIKKAEQLLLLEFAKEAYAGEESKCISIYEQMRLFEIPLSMRELKYYIPELSYESIYDDYQLKESEILRIFDECRINGTITVPRNTTLLIMNSHIKMHGKIVVDGGTLIIKDSRISNRNREFGSMVCVLSHSKVGLYNSRFDCRNCGGVLEQKYGILHVSQCKFFHTTKNSTILFRGDRITVRESKFQDCYSEQFGGALHIDATEGMVNDCFFSNCEAKNGGAIYSNDGVTMDNCKFTDCKVTSYGAAICYLGNSLNKITNCMYEECIPKEEECVQVLEGEEELLITDECVINAATLLKQKIHVTETGRLVIDHCRMFMTMPIHTEGELIIQNSSLSMNEYYKARDMITLKGAKVILENTRFNANLRGGVMNAQDSSLIVKQCEFLNTSKGRAIFRPYELQIESSVFSYCQGGAILTKGGKIKNCDFVNCRDKSGAGIFMYGNGGVIEDCTFHRCVSDYNGGAIDISGRNSIYTCEFEDCKPNNISM